MKKRWEIKPESDEEQIKKLSGQLNGLHPTLANILIQRGITSYSEAKTFFRPSLKHLHDPFMMADMDKATERLIKAMDKGEKVLIYGDYDVDGTTSVALVYSYLSTLYDQLEFYIPNRYSEGYGVSYKGIDYATKQGFSLILTLDCGIKAVEKVAYAKEKGLDFIICDHHRPGKVLPPAVAVLDPKREDCDYPYKELSGCGVGFKLLQAFNEVKNIPFEKLKTYLDYLAVSIAADIVPVTGENRILTYYGLKQLNSHPKPGFKAMIDLAGLKKELSVTDVVFTIAPRINAAGRMESGMKAVEALIASSEKEAVKAGELIDAHNLNRRELDQNITTEALALIQSDEKTIERKTTVVFNETWHKGVIGIVASRLIENYYRPTIVLTKSNGKATGSARSVKGFDVYNAIDACSDLLEQFGGHKYAAGLTMKLENIEAFTEKFEQIVSASIEEHHLKPQITIDAELKIKDINSKFYRILKRFAPFGPGNMRPVFVSRQVLEKGNARAVGKEGDHLKLDVFQPEEPHKIMPAIAFGMGHFEEQIAEGVPFDIVYAIDENEWNGKVSLQLKVKDIRIK